jgi:dinuclear metal center YbgI/SA1388 family protein
MVMKIKEVLQFIETVAPPVYQESYDNAGLIVGDANQGVSNVLLCLDSTEAIIDEAIERDCNLVIAHHPIVFRGLKRLTGKNYVERTIIKAIKNDIAIYAAHTNLDNVLHQGVNGKIAEMLELKNTRILAPKAVLKKISVFLPAILLEQAKHALTESGAGITAERAEHTHASLGVGSGIAGNGAEMKLEALFPMDRQGTITARLEQLRQTAPLTYEIHSVENAYSGIGSGIIGELSKAIDALTFLKKVKKVMQAGCIRHTDLLDKKIKTVALCGGAGGFLLPQAIRNGADVFITGDYKYHEFFDADGKIIIADIGHYESEQYTIQLFQDIISQKFSNFAAYCTNVNTNPVQYL